MLPHVAGYVTKLDVNDNTPSGNNPSWGNMFAKVRYCYGYSQSITRQLAVAREEHSKLLRDSLTQRRRSSIVPR
jgi:hypothetical protein